MTEHELLRKAEALSGKGGFAIDTATCTLCWTPQTFRLHGLTPTEPQPNLDQALGFIHPDDRARWHAGFERALNEGRDFDLEGLMLPAAGEPSRVRAVGRCEPAGPGRWLVVGTLQPSTMPMASALEFVVSAAGIGIWEIHVTSGEEAWSDITLAMYGLPPGSKAPTRTQWREDYLHPDDRARAAARVDDFMATQRPYELDYRIRRKDGTLRWLHSRAVFAYGDRTRVLGITLDITERKLAEQRAAQALAVLDVSAAQTGFGFGYRDLNDHDHDHDHDHENGGSFWSSQLKTMYGLEQDGRTPDFEEFLSLIDPQDRERTALQLQQATEPGQVHDTEFNLRRRNDGQLRHFVNRAVVLRNADTGGLRRYYVVIDLTDLRARDAEVAELLERLKLTTETSGIGTWERNLVTGVGVWDATMRALHGFNHDVAAPSHEQYMSMVHPEDREALLANWQMTREDDRTAIDYQARFVLPCGRVRWLQTRGRIQLGSDGTRLRRMGICFDITERHEAEAALRAKVLAEQANAAKTEFLSRMSHELRTPLNAVLGFAQLMALDNDEPLGRRQRERLEHVHTAGWHLLALINDVLDLARIESRQALVSLDWVALPILIEEAMAMTAVAATQRGIEVSFVQSLDTPAWVWADRTRLAQLLLNLLSNAIKYNVDAGRVELHALVNDAAELVLTVRDTGMGMSAQQLQSLFEPFNRLGRENSGIEGTGIGLTLSKSIAEQMGGRLEVQSSAGQGSEFRIVLPQPQGADAAPPRHI